jgi:hypothetical protein
MKIYSLFVCDRQHNNKTLLGSFSDMGKAIYLAIIDADEGKHGSLTQLQLDLLNKFKQTEGRDENYLIVEGELDEPLD